MKHSDLEILTALNAAILSDTVRAMFPAKAPATGKAFALAFRHAGNQSYATDFPLLTVENLVKQMQDWPMKHLSHFIMHHGDSSPAVVYKHLLEMMISTADLGANAVISLVAKEVELAPRHGSKPREALVARFIDTYGGRISVISGLGNYLKTYFPDSVPIDTALSKHVAVHRVGDQSFNSVARSSDLLAYVDYPKTLKAHLLCLQATGSEHLHQYFFDSASHGMKKSLLDTHIDVLGHDLCLELAGEAMVGLCRAGMAGSDKTFETLINRFGGVALMNTAAIEKDIACDAERDQPSSLLKWYMQRMPLDVPELTEIAIPEAKRLIEKTSVLPCARFIQAWFNSTSPETFLRSFLEAVTVKRSGHAASLSSSDSYRDLMKYMPSIEDDQESHRLETFVNVAHLPQPSFNDLARTIRLALRIAGAEAMSKVVPDLSTRTLEEMVKGMNPLQQQDLIRRYPKASEFVFQADLGL